MGIIDLSLLAKGGLSAKQKADLKKRLLSRKKVLTAEMKSVDKGLKALTARRKKARAKR